MSWCRCDRAGRATRLLAALVVLAGACGGCWEEIHYVPATEPAADPAAEAETAAATPAREDASADIEPAAEPPAVAGRDDVAPPGQGEELAAPPEVAGAAAPAAAGHDLAAGAAELLAPPAAEATPELAAGPRPPPQTATARQRMLVWQAAHKWSFAAAILSKGLDPARYEPLRAEAADAAAELGLELPPLPVAASAEELPALVIGMLRDAAAGPLTEQVGQRFTIAEAALAELAIRSNLLLLSYLPRPDAAAETAAAFGRTAAASGLPAELWQPLVQLLEEPAEFLEVRQAVFELQRLVNVRLESAAEAADDALAPAAAGNP